MSFGGFPMSGLKFLRDLDRNNERPWFKERKEIYLNDVDAPLKLFVAELASRLRAAKIPLAPNPKNPTFRIYRDVRFSKDKRPYNTHVSAALYRDGNVTAAGVLYVHLDPREPFVASGFYHPEKPALDALREMAYADPKPLLKIITKLERENIILGSDDTLVRVPPAFCDAAGTPAEAFVKLKSFIVRTPLDPKLLGSPDILEDVVRFARAAMPILTWGWKAIDVV